MVADITPEYQSKSRKRVHIRVHKRTSRVHKRVRKSTLEPNLSVPIIKKSLLRDITYLTKYEGAWRGKRTPKAKIKPNPACWGIGRFSRAIYRLGY